MSCFWIMCENFYHFQHNNFESKGLKVELFSVILSKRFNSTHSMITHSKLKFRILCLSKVCPA